MAHLNIELVHSLRASDSAFSVGEAAGLAVVKFGMLADAADLEVTIVSLCPSGLANSVSGMGEVRRAWRCFFEEVGRDWMKNAMILSRSHGPGD